MYTQHYSEEVTMGKEKEPNAHGPDERKTYKSSNKPFEGSTPLLKGYYYTFNQEQQKVNEFQETTDKVIEVDTQAIPAAQGHP
jgi:hypothetical protein